MTRMWPMLAASTPMATTKVKLISPLAVLNSVHGSTPLQLWSRMQRCGKVKAVIIPTNSDLSNKGVAYVQFDSESSVPRAMRLRPTQVRNKDVKRFKRGPNPHVKRMYNRPYSFSSKDRLHLSDKIASHRLEGGDEETPSATMNGALADNSERGLPTQASDASETVQRQQLISARLSAGQSAAGGFGSVRETTRRSTANSVEDMRATGASVGNGNRRSTANSVGTGTRRTADNVAGNGTMRAPGGSFKFDTARSSERQASGSQPSSSSNPTDSMPRPPSYPKLSGMLSGSRSSGMGTAPASRRVTGEQNNSNNTTLGTLPEHASAALASSAAVNNANSGSMQGPSPATTAQLDGSTGTVQLHSSATTGQIATGSGGVAYVTSTSTGLGKTADKPIASLDPNSPVCSYPDFYLSCVEKCSMSLRKQRTEITCMVERCRPCHPNALTVESKRFDG